MVPVFVGTCSREREAVMRETFPDATYVRCEPMKPGWVGCIQCHKSMARAALQYFGNRDGVYLALEDAARVTGSYTSRAEVDRAIEDAADVLRVTPDLHLICLHRGHPVFVHWAYKHVGRNVYQKTYHCGSMSIELTQALLCTTQFARWLLDKEFTREIDVTLNEEKLLQHVVYPAVFRRSTESETRSMATPVFQSGVGKLARDMFFNDAVFRTAEWCSYHAWWLPAMVGCVLLLK